MAYGPANSVSRWRPHYTPEAARALPHSKTWNQASRAEGLGGPGHEGQRGCLQRARGAEAPLGTGQNQPDQACTGCLVFTGTGVSQWWRSAFSPFTMAKNSFWMALVMGPVAPLPTLILSTERIGVTSAA